MKRIRSVMVTVAAAVGILVGPTLPAHAADISGNYKYIAIWNTGWCAYPTNDNLGQVVSVDYGNPCSGRGENWGFLRLTPIDSRGGAWYEIYWNRPDGVSGCLVPNWNRDGSPIVDTTCSSNSQWHWYAWPEGAGQGAPYEFVNGANTNLVLDASGGTLHETTANYSLYQQFQTIP